ncbi:hypothetical protein BgiBS90_023466 [Biomphalaria glabrata]|nr:hypothetical protein BgiBS90_023466 [Biomphalaria glabrata]
MELCCTCSSKKKNANAKGNNHSAVNDSKVKKKKDSKNSAVNDSKANHNSKSVNSRASGNNSVVGETNGRHQKKKKGLIGKLLSLGRIKIRRIKVMLRV